MVTDDNSSWKLCNRVDDDDAGGGVIKCGHVDTNLYTSSFTETRVVL